MNLVRSSKSTLRVNVIEGELELTVESKKYNLTPGNVMVLEPNVIHSGRAVKA
jgi:quercetin dioxygenase-like cupin family protein